MTNRSVFAGKASLLALDSGGRACSVAVWSDGVAVAREAVATDHGHATLLLPMIERVMAAARIEYAALDRIAVAVGPGSFTGLRVGLAAALGFGLAVARPVIGISSFQAAAARIDPGLCRGRRLFVVLDSRRDQLFVAELDATLSMARPPTIADRFEIGAMLAGAGPALLLGDIEVFADGAPPPNVLRAPTMPDAIAVAVLAADPSGRFDLDPKPIYLRPPDVTPAKAP